MPNKTRDKYWTKLRLMTPPIASHDEPVVFVPSINYDADLDAYYVGANEAGDVTLESKRLPANFHTHELMEVDPSDRLALLDFQRTWGLLTSPNREPLREDTFNTNATIATPLKDTSDEEAFEESKQLLARLSERHEDFRSVGIGIRTTVEPGRNGAYVFAPGDEVEAALAALQSAVKTLTKAHVEGFDNWAGIEGRNLRAMVGEADKVIEPYYPRYRMFEASMDGSDAVEPVLPLTIATLAQLLAYIASDEGYRECKLCHRYFLYKRHTSGEFVRNRRSLYCSDDCKQRASSTAQAARRKAARHAKKQNGEEER